MYTLTRTHMDIHACRRAHTHSIKLSDMHKCIMRNITTSQFKTNAFNCNQLNLKFTYIMDVKTSTKYLASVFQEVVQPLQNFTRYAESP